MIAAYVVFQHQSGRYPLLQDHRKLRKEFWGRHLWARGYFVATTGNVSDTMVAEYIETQDVETRDDDFRVTE